MTPTWVLATLHGDAEPLRQISGPLEARDIDVAELVAFEGGHDRVAVTRYWGNRSGTRLIGAVEPGSLDDGMRGVVVLHMEGSTAHVEHLVAGSDVDDDDAFRVLAAAIAATDAIGVEAYVPEVRPLHRRLMALGFVTVDASMFMSSRAGVVSDRLHVLHPGLC